MSRVGGVVSFQANGGVLNAKGAFSFNKGNPKRKTVTGADRVHGHTEEPQPGFIEGAVTIDENTDVDAITSLKGATVTLVLGSGQTVICRDAVYTADGTGDTEEGELEFRVEGKVEIV